jgi:hypothetical protein
MGLGLGVYANNTAAKAGGLIEYDVYKTSTGELRIVVWAKIIQKIIP